MFKKIAFAAVGLSLLASPFIASAQVSLPQLPANPTLADLQTEIQLLIQILNQLLAGRSQHPSATIDQSSLTADTGGKDSALVTITGEASGVSQVSVTLKGGGGIVPVVNGMWSISIGQPVGTYQVEILDEDSGKNNNTVLATGTLTVIDSAVTGLSGTLLATDPNPISYAIVAGGSTGVTVGSFTLQPSGENVSVQQIGLDLAAQHGSASDVTRAYIYQGSTLVGTTIFTGSPSGNCPPAFTGVLSGGCYFATTTISSSGQLAQNSQTNFTVKVDVAPIGIGQPGTPGDQIVIGLSDAEAIGLNSGAIIHSGSAPNQTGVRIFKSYPTVTFDPLISSNVDFSPAKQPALLRFKVTASPSGSIGLGIIPVQVSASGVTFGSVTAYGYTDSLYSQPIPGTVQGALVTVNPSAGLTGSFSIPLSNNGGPIEIPAGQTYYFQILGNNSNATGNVVVTTSLSPDSQYVGIGSYGGNTTRFGSNANFIWSPNDNGTSQFSDNDWTNGLGVPGLSGISQTRTGISTTQSPVRIVFLSVQNGSIGVNAVAAGTPATLQFQAVNAARCDLLTMNNPNGSYMDQFNNGQYSVYASNIGSGGDFGTPASLVQITPTQTDTMVMLHCVGQDGSSALDVVHVGMQAATQTLTPAPTVSLTQSLTTTTASQTFNVSWSSTNATSCTVQKTRPDGTLINPWGSGTSGTVVASPGQDQVGTIHWWIDCTGAGGTAHADMYHTITSAPSPLVTYVSISGNTVSATYANLPANAQIVVVNQTSGQPVSGISSSVSGSGTVSLGGIPTGAFYLRAQDATSGAYIAQSVGFYSTAPAVVPTSTGTCTLTQTTPWASRASATQAQSTSQSATIQGGTSACAQWCSSINAENYVAGATPSCTYNGSAVPVSNPNSLLGANALSALQAALQGFLASLGK